MATQLGTLTVDIKANTGNFQKEMAKVEKSLDSVVVTAKKFSAVSKKLSVGFAAVGAAGAVLVKKSLDVASSFEETQNVLQLTFGPKNVAMVNNWAEEFGSAANRSRLQMVKFAGGLNSVLSPMVENEEAANKMSLRMSELAVNLGSAFEKADEDVLIALRSAFSGATEPMRQFGVIMTQNSLNAFALTQGLKKTVNEMSEAEKTVLRYNFILEKTRRFQGDAVNTGDSFANAVKGIGAQFENLQLIIGQKILPKFTGFAIAIRDGIKSIAALDPSILAMAANFIVAGTAISVALAGLFTLGIAVGPLAKGFQVLGVAAAFASKNLTFSAIANTLNTSLQSLKDTVLVTRLAFAILQVEATKTFASMKAATKGLTISSVLQKASAGFTILTTTMASAATAASGFAASMLAALAPFLAVAAAIGGVILIIGAVALAWDELKAAVKFAAKAIADTVEKHFEGVREGILRAAEAFPFLGGAISGVAKIAKLSFNDILKGVGDLVKKSAQAGVFLGKILGTFSEATAIGLFQQIEKLPDLTTENIGKGMDAASAHAKAFAETVGENMENVLTVWNKGLEVIGLKQGKALEKNLGDGAKAAAEEALRHVQQLMSAFQLPAGMGGGVGMGSIAGKAAKADDKDVSPFELNFDEKVGAFLAGRQKDREDVIDKELQDRLAAAKDSINGSVTGLVGSMGDVGQVFNAANAAIKTGDPTAAIVGLGVELLSRTKGFKMLSAKLNEMFGDLVKAIDPIVNIIAALLEPQLKLFEKQIEGLSKITFFVSNIISKVVLGIAKVFNGIIGAISSIFKKIGNLSVFGKKPLKGLRDFGNTLDRAKVNTEDLRLAMMGIQKGTGEAKMGLRDFKKAASGTGEALCATSPSEDLCGAVDKVAGTMNEVNESLTNVPAGFKVAQLRFESASADFRNLLSPSAGVTGGGLEARGNVNVEKIEIVSDDPLTIWTRIKEIAQFDQFTQTGTTVQPTQAFAIPRE